MKWLSFLVVLFVVLNLCFPPAALTEEEKPVVIRSISHSKDSKTKETFTFKLAAAVSPKMFIMDGDNPRLVIDFPESIYYGKNTIPLTDSHLASSVRVGLHQTPVQRTRVVIDLTKQLPVSYSSEYADEDNILSIILTVAAAEPRPQASPEHQARNRAETLKEEKATKEVKAAVPPLMSQKSIKSQKKKTVLVAPPVKEEPKPEPAQPVAQSTDDSGKPKLLEVSFDDSSNKGEMVLFRLNDFYPPTVSAIQKDTPRVLCDFMAMELGPDVQPTILAKGKYIERIRTAIHHDPESVRVVLDLSPDRDYDLQQVFFRNDNLFVLIVNELAPDQSSR